MSKPCVALLGSTLFLLASASTSAELSHSRLMDPTRPMGWQSSLAPVAESQAASAQALRLQGTFSAAGERSAVISGRRVSVGERVAGAQVIKIESNKVILLLDGETVELAATVVGVKSPVNTQGDRE